MTTLPDRPSVHDFLAAPIEVALDVAGVTPSCGNADEPNERALQRIGTKAEAWYACDQGFAKVTVTHRNEAHHSLDADVAGGRRRTLASVTRRPDPDRICIARRTGIL